MSEANKREGVGRDDLVEMLDVFGPGRRWRAARRRRRPDDAALALLAARNAARAAKDWAEADRLRDALPTRAGRSATAPTAPSWSGMTPGGPRRCGGGAGRRRAPSGDGRGGGRARATGQARTRAGSRCRAGRRRRRAAARRASARSADVLYGRNPIFEALRAGRREVKRIWATAGAAKEPWLDGVPLRARRRRLADPARRQRRPPGPRRRRRAVPVRRPGVAADRRPRR